MPSRNSFIYHHHVCVCKKTCAERMTKKVEKKRTFCPLVWVLIPRITLLFCALLTNRTQSVSQSVSQGGYKSRTEYG